MTESAEAQRLTALANHLSQRREAILAVWRNAVENDPELNTASVVSRTQFYDHIPAVLSAFERELTSDNETGSLEAHKKEKEYAARHGQHRWQQGYNQEEVVREWGHLHVCLLDELESYGATHAFAESSFMARARRSLGELCIAGMTESVVEYSRLQQQEAGGRMRDLQEALGKLEELERERARAWREAAHDLRTKVGLVGNVTALLQGSRGSIE